MEVPDGFLEHPLHKGYFATPEGGAWSRKTGRIINGYLRGGKRVFEVFDGSGRKKCIFASTFVDECLRGSTGVPEGFLPHPIYTEYAANAQEEVWSNRIKRLIVGHDRNKINYINIAASDGSRVIHNRRTFVAECLRGVMIPDGFHPHPIYTDYYANSEGHIWSVKSRSVIGGHMHASGYMKVGVFMNSKLRNLCMHVIVFECFHGMKPSGATHQIDHIDGDKSNNRLENLQLLSVPEHASKTRKNSKTPAEALSKPVRAYKLDGSGQRIDVREYANALEACSDLGGTNNIGISIKNGWKRSGYHWEYIEQPDLEGEVWCSLRDPKYGRLRVSSRGRIMTSMGKKTFGTQIHSGYYKTTIQKKNYLVHRLVCLAFHGPPPTPEHTVDHINEIKSCNDFTNLRWATQHMQVIYKLAKPVAAYTANGAEYKRWISIADAARELNVNARSIGKAVGGKVSTCAGLSWKLLPKIA